MTSTAADVEALIADLDRQIVAQQKLLADLRAAGESTRRAAIVLTELHQKADRQRDYLRVIREGSGAAAR